MGWLRLLTLLTIITSIVFSLGFVSSYGYDTGSGTIVRAFIINVTNTYVNETNNITNNIINNITTYQNTSEIDPLFIAGNASIWAEAQNKFNTTYDAGIVFWYNFTIVSSSLYAPIIWDYNQSLFIENTYGKWFYNMSGGLGNESFNQTLTDSLYSDIKWGYNMSGSGGGNESFNQTLTDSLYSDIKWDYNQTYSGSTSNSTYDETTASFNGNVTMIYNHTNIIETLYGKYFYNMTSAFTTWLSTFAYDYNQTASAMTYTDTVIVANDSRWTDTFNSTYDAKAGTGDCPIGEIVVNTTTSGVQCISLTTIYYNASQSEIIVGTIDGGTLEDTQHSNGKYDGKTFNFTEVSTTPGLDLRINFTGIVNFNQGVMRYKTSSGLNGAYPIIQMWNYDTNLWEDYPAIAQSTTFATITQPVFDLADHVDVNGVAQMRIYKATKGNTGNHYYIDWIAISKGYGTPSGEEIDPYSVHLDGTTSLTGNWDAGLFNITANWFDGLFNWTTTGTGWLIFDGAVLTYNTTKLNETIGLTGVAYGFNSTYNSTYDAGKSYWYNFTTLADLTYSPIKWDYNFTTLSTVYTNTQIIANTTYLENQIKLNSSEKANVGSAQCAAGQYASNITINGGTALVCSTPASGSGGLYKAANVTTFTATGAQTWNAPANITWVRVQCWGGGGAGGLSGTGGGGGGGGGGGYVDVILSAVSVANPTTVTIGAGGAASKVNDTDGASGLNSTFGTYATAYAGGGGASTAGASAGGGGGAGATSSGASATSTTGVVGGTPCPGAISSATTCGYGGGGGSSTGSAGGDSFWGGAGGGFGSATTTAMVGGNTYYGGAGGGGGADTADGVAGGTSTFGGNGGKGSTNGVNGVDGVQPGGGGGGAEYAYSGKGGDGECIITAY